MILDVDMLRGFYASYASKVERARVTIGRPLTYAEKVLYAHLYNPDDLLPYKRGESYVVTGWLCRTLLRRWPCCSS